LDKLANALDIDVSQLIPQQNADIVQSNNTKFYSCPINLSIRGYINFAIYKTLSWQNILNFDQAK
jgi:hypothetical protein